jgi:hypothetical protein
MFQFVVGAWNHTMAVDQLIVDEYFVDGVLNLWAIQRLLISWLLINVLS